MPETSEKQYYTEIGCLGAAFDSLEHFRMHTTRNLSMHIHSTYELYLLYEGEALIRTESGIHPLQAGQAALIAPHTYHAISNVTEGFRLGAVHLQLYKLASPTNAEETRLHSLLDAASLSSVTLLGQQPQLLTLILQFMQAQTSREVGNAYLLRSYCTQILVFLLRALPVPDVPNHTGKTAPNITGTTQMERTNIIDDYIYMNYLDADITILAEMLSISEQHLRRFLKTAYGMSFSELLNRQRIQIAKHLLRTTTAPVSEIWPQVGFQSPQHFYQAFKRYTGMTATAYRAQFR